MATEVGVHFHDCIPMKVRPIAMAVAVCERMEAA